MTAPPYMNQLSRRAPLLIAVMLAIGASVCTTTSAAMTVSARPTARVCQRQPGHTIFRSGSIRVFRESHHVYGCVRGHTRRVLLWVKVPEQQSSLQGSVGHDIAVQSVLNNQYGFSQSLWVVNLLDGATYPIASYGGNVETGTVSGNPATPGPWPLEGFAMSSKGLTARLYDTFAPGSGLAAEPTGQVLDVIGPRGYDRTLALTGPGAIAPASLAWQGSVVIWTQNGTPESAMV